MNSLNGAYVKSFDCLTGHAPNAVMVEKTILNQKHDMGGTPMLRNAHGRDAHVRSDV
jgi:hypothetical protein